MLHLVRCHCSTRLGFYARFQQGFRKLQLPVLFSTNVVRYASAVKQTIVVDVSQSDTLSGDGVTQHKLRQPVNFGNIIPSVPGVVKSLRKKWTDDEMSSLRQLVESQAAESRDWISIGKTLHRSPRQCQGKWKTLEYALQGRFTPEEDALILETAKDWETGQRKDKGLWTSLGEKMQRDYRIVRNRYRVLIIPQKEGVQKRKSITQWTAEMNTALIEARANLPHATWTYIAAHLNTMGYEVSGNDCRWRWFHSLQELSAGRRSKVDWTAEEVETLLKLRNEENLHWKQIGRYMNILSRACYDKYKSVTEQYLKRGLYTAEEDECILEAVKEWGDPRERRGLWVQLQEKMQRPPNHLRARWLHLITKQAAL